MLVLVHLKKNFVLALSVVEILRFSIFWVVSMEDKGGVQQQLIQFFCQFCE